MKTMRVTNYKAIKDVELIPNGSLAVIAGKNGQGKSSFLDAIMELIDPRGVKLTPKPIRDGEKQAKAEFTDTELGVKLTRTWRSDGTAGTLTAETLDGAKYSRPSEIVAQLTGGAVIDPVRWLNLDEKKQLEELLSIVELPFDIDQLAADKKQAEEDRLVIGREVKRLKSVVDSMPPKDDTLPKEERSMSDLIEKINAAQEAVDKLNTAKIQIDSSLDRIKRIDQQIAELKSDREKIVETLNAALEYEQSAPSNPQSEVDELKAELAGLESVNQKVREQKSRAAAEQSHEAAVKQHAEAQARIDAIEKTKRDGLAKANFPVAGLSVDENGITFDGIPWVQVNSAHRRKVALAIAMSGSPDLKLAIIKDGDLLDEDSLADVEEMAAERGYTVLVERDRDKSSEMGFVIHDGELA